MARVAVLCPDLLFGSKLEGGLGAAGHDVERVDDEPGAWTAVRAGAEVLVVDLASDAFDGAVLVDSMRADGALREVTTVGFYPHVDQRTRRRAGEAGFDVVVPRSRMAREMDGVLERALAARATGAESDPRRRGIEGEERGSEPASRARAGRTALVTGASSGIGAATARRLDREGWRVLLVARRADWLAELGSELRDARWLALDLVEGEAPSQIAEWVSRLGRLELLVNNAGSSWRARFGDDGGGYANVRRTLALNFDAPVRLTEALLPVLRRSAPSAVVNVSSVAGRIAQAGSGAYAASKFALAGWSDALALEEREHGVHVGLVLPGPVATEGFPHHALRRSARTRWLVSTPERVADAIVETGPGQRSERYVPSGWALAPLVRALAPGLWRRAGGVRP